MTPLVTCPASHYRLPRPSPPPSSRFLLRPTPPLSPQEENTITYSLLQHPEAQEQEPADYQNM